MLRRIVIVLLIFVVVLVAVLSVGDILVRREVQKVVAHRIEKQVPGSHASVTITSFPFVWHVATAGSVPKLVADVTDVTAGDLSFASIDVTITDLVVERSELLDGSVKIEKVRQVVVAATMTQAAVDRAVGSAVQLGDDTVGLDGVSVPAQITIAGDKVTIGAAPTDVTLTVPALSLLPCVSAVTVTQGQMTLMCHTTTVPPALAETVTSST